MNKLSLKDSSLNKSHHLNSRLFLSRLTAGTFTRLVTFFKGSASGKSPKKPAKSSKDKTSPVQGTEPKSEQD